MNPPGHLRPSRSITLRILMLVWVSFTVTFLTLILLNTRQLRLALLERGRLRASSIADLLEYAFEPLLERGDYESIQRCAENAATIEGVERVWMVGRDGRVLASGDAADVGRQVAAESDVLASLISDKEPEHVWQEGSGPRSTLNFVKPLRGGGFDPRDRTDLIAAIWVRLSLRPLYTRIVATLTSLVAVSLLCAGLLSLALGWILSRTVARPLVNLSRATTEVARGNLEAEVPVRGHDEIGLLARNFRTMTRALAEARREIEAFLFLVSHDLRGPVVNIEGFTQRLRDTLEEVKPHVESALARPPEKRAGVLPAPGSGSAPEIWRRWIERETPQCFDFIQKSVDKVRRLVDGLHKLSRLPMRPTEIRGVAVQILVERVIASMRPALAARGLRVEVGSLPEVKADEQLLSEVLASLIQNALQYMGPQPSPQLIIACTREGEEWRFSVADNGMGISPKNQARLFTPFQRFAPESAQGEGISLCLVRRSLQRMGGSVWVESRLGGGSTFFFTLPVEPLPQRATGALWKQDAAAPSATRADDATTPSPAGAPEPASDPAGARGPEGDDLDSAVGAGGSRGPKADSHGEDA